MPSVSFGSKVQMGTPKAFVSISGSPRTTHFQWLFALVRESFVSTTITSRGCATAAAAARRQSGTTRSLRGSRGPADEEEEAAEAARAQQEEMDMGRRRGKKDVTYHENLSEKDWLKAIGAEEDESDDGAGGFQEETPKKKKKKRGGVINNENSNQSLLI